MVVVVIGGTGFIGKALVARLRALGIQVRTYSRRSADSVGHEDHYSGQLTDSRELRRALKGAEYVFHLAWTTVPQTSNEDLHSDINSNLANSCRVLDSCREVGISCVVFLSSGGTVYGSGHMEPLDETAPTDPICSYGITKLAFEKYLALARHLHGLDYRILRVSNAYGEGQPTNRPQGLIGVTMARLLNNQPIIIWGDGTAVRDYIYVDDVVDSCIASMRHLPKTVPRVFNVSTQTGYSVQQVLSSIQTTANLEPIVTYEASRSCDVDRVVLSNARARQFLGWEPKVTLAEGLRRTWAFFRKEAKVPANLASLDLSPNMARG